MNKIAIFGIITTTSTVATPVPGTGCSSIIPAENCMNALSTGEAEDLITTILSDLVDMAGVLSDLPRLTGTAALLNERYFGPYRLDNTGDRLCEPMTNATDCIVRSVYRFKCEVPLVADIMKNEFIRKLVQEESDNYATTVKVLLNNLSVIFNLKSLVSRYQPLNSCTVPEESCQTFNSTGLDRIVLIQAVAEDIFQLQADLGEALRTFQENI